MKVFVYFNLHKKCWSVRSVSTGRVIDHTYHVVLKDPLFKVSPAGRKRVLAERKKNVHAGVQGELAPNFRGTHVWNRVTYNPYKYESFVRLFDESRIDFAKYAILNCEKTTIVLAGE